jgi:hypothetical protein
MRTGADSYIAHGDADVLDAHLICDVHAVDADIIRWLTRGRRRRRLARIAHLIRPDDGVYNGAAVARGTSGDRLREK